ncbi:gamma-glutamylcyclotransferase-like [Ptychodera flava]|uniref:gamma-glutamylcyclotransferase-like n=1 Tax=Ptychodera flava TaxID=63121 RepID=UPI00396AB010
MSSTLFFGYSTTLLDERVFEIVPTAKFRTIAKLQNHKLVFNDAANYESPWHGATANIVPCDGEEVWGVVYETEQPNIGVLEKHLVGERGIYVAHGVMVTTPKGKMLTCTCLKLRDPLPLEGVPSPQYLSVLIAGAVQKNLPKDYIAKLKSSKHNSYDGKIGISEKILLASI